MTGVQTCALPILSIAAAVEDKYPWVIVDGNRETDPLEKIKGHLSTGDFGFFGCTVMPGPQLKEAVLITQQVKAAYPELVIIWGGYFPSNQYKVVLESGIVDFVINGPGDLAFPELLDALSSGGPLDGIRNLIFQKNGQIIKNPKGELPDQDSLPPLPYGQLDRLYGFEKYLGKTYLGNRTLAYHSSIGCPFTCSFCAVVPIYEARWKAKSAEGIYKDIKYVKDRWGADSIEFHDNNFFVSEKRVNAFSRLIRQEDMVWWGEGRIDTIDKYSDSSIALMREAGCKMIFFGAETGNDEILKKMNKGGTQSGDQIRKFARRMRQFDIIPEYSFVLGTPQSTPQLVMNQIDQDIAFIKEIKSINPDTEIVIYIYSPVPTPGSYLYDQVLATGFRFPEKLADWVGPQWESFDLRKNPLTPWLTVEMVDKIKDFETVLNGFYPTVSDIRLSAIKRRILHLLSGLRYRRNWYNYPLEIKLLHKIWKYRQPEIQGF